MNFIIAVIMFLIAAMAMIRGFARDESEPFIVAGLFCLAGCVLIK